MLVLDLTSGRRGVALAVSAGAASHIGSAVPASYPFSGPATPSAGAGWPPRISRDYLAFFRLHYEILNFFSAGACIFRRQVGYCDPTDPGDERQERKYSRKEIDANDNAGRHDPSA
jgi:hypothetical protein